MTTAPGFDDSARDREPPAPACPPPLDHVLPGNASGLDIELIPGEELRLNTWLQTELALIAAPSYDDASAILAREVADCTHLYIGRDTDGQLAGFFMTRRDSLGAEPGLPLVHVGWSASRHDLKNSGATMALFERCIVDVQAWERQLGRRALLWSTTASPTIYLGVSRFLAHVEPHHDGSYSAEGARLARLLRERLGAPPPAANEHPFAVRGIAAATRYSTSERQRIARICARKSFSLFDQLDIDESREDRLIFIARTPADIGTALSRASTLALARRGRHDQRRSA
ncbi:MAG: hypothetical protein C0434_03140 [Xanthomonadaceae bacterium]|nr:hypothetical protein [Xanthomonadaceae bacterium]